MAKNYTAEEILANPDLYEETVEPKTLFSCIRTGDIQGFKELWAPYDKVDYPLYTCDSNGNTMLHAAIKSRHSDMLEYIFSLYNDDPMVGIAVSYQPNFAGKTARDVLKEGNSGPVDTFSRLGEKLFKGMEYEAAIQRELFREIYAKENG